MMRGLPSSLRNLVVRLQAHVATRRGAYPHTSAALEDLKRALAAEFIQPAGPRRPGRGGASRSGDQEKRARRWYMRCHRLRAEVTSLKKELAKHTTTKTKERRMEQEWIVRVMLAAPHTSGRALAQAFRDVAGSDACTVSRSTIGRIKDARAEMYPEMVLQAVAMSLGAHKADATHHGRPFVTMHMLHVQDEAELRLRSGDVWDGPDVPRRARASKVQQHVLSVVVGHRQWEIPTEMEALGDKRAGTLATSLDSLLRRTWAAVARGLANVNRGGQGDIWIVHHLVGDGIATNEAATRILWSCAQERPLGPSVRYFLIVVKCATHQAALSAKYAVIGGAAELAGGSFISMSSALQFVFSSTCSPTTTKSSWPASATRCGSGCVWWRTVNLLMQLGHRRAF